MHRLTLFRLKAKKFRKNLKCHILRLPETQKKLITKTYCDSLLYVKRVRLMDSKTAMLVTVLQNTA